MKYCKILSSILALMLAAWASLAANSGSPVPNTPTPSAPRLTPEQQAVQYYNQGLAHRDKAWKHEKKAQEADNEKKRAKELEKAQKQYKNAIKQYRSAIKLVDGFYQAYGSLGYALRRSGNYEESLQAYNHSLAIKPDYVEAIEYRGEAYLGLNRIEDAKAAYMSLFRMDREQASVLLSAMKNWVEERKEKTSTDGETEQFASWIAERDEIAQQSSSSGDGHGW